MIPRLDRCGVTPGPSRARGALTRPCRALALGVAALAHAAAAQSPDERVLEQIVVVGVRAVVPGSATVIDKAELERFDHIDVGQVLAAHPGVYLREEDGYGLRPNIGIRGAAAERSQKITLLEDGVPIAPAPYSAPAAYYMPNVSRAQAVEVLKGPAAIAHGPHTVGGAINFVTRSVPAERLAEVDVSVGVNGFHKLAAAYGDGGESGFLIEALRYGSDGFKALDGGGDTGFVRDDLSVKLRWGTADERRQRLTLRVGAAAENSNETYLGLADADFLEAPRRRYAASRLDAFQSRHVGGLLNYGVNLGAGVRVNAKAYWNGFDRQWNKLDGFMAGRALQSVLAQPQRHRQAYRLLTGAADSIDTATQILDVTDNDRSYFSRGLLLTVTATRGAGALSHHWTAGVRLHRDEVERDHRPRGYLMQSGRMIFDGIDRGSKLRNRADSQAIAVHVADEIVWRDFTLAVGVRFEDINGRFEDRRHARSGAEAAAKESAQRVLAPGIGLHWQVGKRLGLLVGAHRGFSPAGPGSQAEHERSVNIEYGARYRAAGFDAELLGFFSDYGNLLGRCRVSDAGCQAGEEFNAGRVKITGAELAASARRELGRHGLRLQARLAYTYTQSAFRSGFLSGFPQWGLVSEGDELPYLPKHCAQLRFGLTKGPWDVFAAIKSRSPMREEPGRGAVRDGLHADGLTTLDLTAAWRFGEATLVQAVVGNVTDEAAIVSHRPLGARPNRPRWLTLRLRHAF